MTVYCVWAYDNYYPTGPNDLKGVYLTEEAAEVKANALIAGRHFDIVEVTKEVTK